MIDGEKIEVVPFKYRVEGSCSNCDRVVQEHPVMVIPEGRDPLCPECCCDHFTLTYTISEGYTSYLEKRLEDLKCCGNCGNENLSYGDNECEYYHKCKKAHIEPNNMIDYWEPKKDS